MSVSCSLNYRPQNETFLIRYDDGDQEYEKKEGVHIVKKMKSRQSTSASGRKKKRHSKATNKENKDMANIIQKALIFSRGAPIQTKDIDQAIGNKRGIKKSEVSETEDVIRSWMRSRITLKGRSDHFGNIMDHLASILISETLNLTNGNRSRAAKILGVSRPTLHAKIAKYGLTLKTTVDGEDRP